MEVSGQFYTPAPLFRAKTPNTPCRSVAPKSHWTLPLLRSSWTLFPSSPTYNGPQFLHSFHTKIVVFNPPPQVNMINKQKTRAKESNCPCSRSMQLSTQLTSFTGRWFPTYPKRASDLVVRNDCWAKAKLEGYLEERDKEYQLLLNGSKQSSYPSTCLTQSSEDNNYMHDRHRKKKKKKKKGRKRKIHNEDLQNLHSWG